MGAAGPLIRTREHMVVIANPIARFPRYLGANGGFAMRGVLSAVMVLMLATAASAEQWTYENAAVPIAYIDNGAAQVQFACRGGDFTVGFWVRAPHGDVAKAQSMHLAISADPAEGAVALAGASFAQDMPLIHSDGASMVIRGPVARQWAAIAQRAATTIRMAYVRKAGSTEVFNSNDFSAAGSTAAIKKVLDRCG